MSALSISIVSSCAVDLELNERLRLITCVNVVYVLVNGLDERSQGIGARGGKQCGMGAGERGGG